MPVGQYIRKVRPIIFLPDNPRIALVELTRNQFSVIDREDAERVGQYNWQAHWAKSTRSFYATTLFGGKYGNHLALHQFLIGKMNGMSVDHINPTNTLDNRKCNLRHADRTTQNTNQRMRRDNTSGYKNVRRVRDKWRVVAQKDKKQVHVGYFANLQDAIAAAAMSVD